MFFHRGISSFSTLASRSPCAAIRMASTLVGASGRVYTDLEVMRVNYKTKEPQIVKAQCDNEMFVYKHVSESVFSLSQELAATFRNTDRLRVHTDYNEEQRMLVYPYFRDTLMGLLKKDDGFLPAERPKILRATAEAIHEMHSQGWVHFDVKPDNILVDWESDQDGHKTVTKTVLGDLDLAFNPPPGGQLHASRALGNYMWRSPEGQTGKGITAASEVYSFGLVCIYALGGGEYLVPSQPILDDLAKEHMVPEQEILTRHFLYFGPATQGLLDRVRDETWCKRLQAVSDTADEAARADPQMRFTDWGQPLGPNAVDLISRMTNTDPEARPTMEQVLAHPWWQEG